MRLPSGRRRRATGPASLRIRRLRWSLTAAFALCNLLGLAVLAVIAAETDRRSERRAVFDEMRRRTTGVVRLLYYQDGRLRLDGLADDDTTRGVPQIVVLEGSRRVFTSADPPYQVADVTLRRLTATAMARDDDVRAAARDRNGRDLDLLASPFHNDATGAVAGAAIAIADLDRGSARHRTLVLSLVAGCAALTAVSLTGGYLLAGRSLRPALTALDQQERFLADAAHELRNPLAALRVNLDTALAPYPEGPAAEGTAAGRTGTAPGPDRTDPDQAGAGGTGTEMTASGPMAPDVASADTGGARALALRRAARTAERMHELVDDLLDRARVMAGAHEVRTERLRLDQLVADLVEEISGGAQVTLHTAPAVVEGDPTLLRLAVRNLIDNALRHGRRDGAAAEVTVTVDGGTITVADRGPGLPAGSTDSVFDRFRTGSVHGTGLGLAIVRWVAHAHQGTVVSAPAPDGGTVFRLTLGPGRGPA